ncbi:MAG: chemotaxis protein CheW [Mariprofundaceae bacterium]
MQSSDSKELLTFLVGHQWVGLDIDQVREVLSRQPFTPVPMASAAVLGLINLRGRVVTILDARTVVGIPMQEEEASQRVLIIESESEAIGLVVDAVGEVMPLEADSIESSPDSLPLLWKEFSDGIIQQEERVILLMNIKKFLDISIQQQTETKDINDDTRAINQGRRK